MSAIVSAVLVADIVRLTMELFSENQQQVQDLLDQYGHVDLLALAHHIPLMALDTWDAVYGGEPPQQSALGKAINAVEAHNFTNDSEIITQIKLELGQKCELGVYIQMDGDGECQNFYLIPEVPKEEINTEAEAEERARRRLRNREFKIESNITIKRELRDDDDYHSSDYDVSDSDDDSE
jgi:hypothetical protein